MDESTTLTINNVRNDLFHWARATWKNSELLLFCLLGVLGSVASYLSIKIPYTEVYIEVRWAFGFMGFALLKHWWSALLLACLLSITGFHQLPLTTCFVGNMLYAVPAWVTIRLIHARVLARLRNLALYGVSWLLLVLVCYQAFNTPLIWAFMAVLRDAPVGPFVLSGWQEQPFLVESVLVGIVSASGMIVLRSYNELRRNRRELSITLDSIGDGVIATDAQGNVIRMNPTAQALTGWSLQQAQGKPLAQVFNVVNAKTRARCENPVARVLNAGRAIGLVNHTMLIAQDGAEYQIADSAAPIRDAQGNTTGVVLVFRDVTQEYHMQAALRESEAKFRSLFQHMAAACCLDQVVYEDGKAIDYRVLDVNPSYEKIIGVSRSQVVGKLASQLYGMQEVPFLGIYAQVAETGKPAAFEDYFPPVDKHLHVTVGCPAKGRFSTVFSDITARKQVEADRERLLVQVQEQARQVQQIMDTVPEGMLLLDANQRVLLANPAAKRDLALLVGRKVCEPQWKDERQPQWKDERQPSEPLTHLGERPLSELLTSPPKGLWHEVQAGTRTFEVIARPIHNGPEPERWVMVIKDATRERALRAQLEQQERLAAIGQLAAGIAHDFNNILAVIVLYAQMAAQSETSSEQDRERMETITQQAWDATRLIQQILDFGRRAVLDRQPLDLLPLLKEQVKLLKRTLPEHIEIDLDWDSEAHTVSADPTRMQQMITNLAVNARDAMPQGGALRIGLERVTVRTGESPLLPPLETGEWVRLSVADTGVGILPEALSHIFEPFFTTKPPGQGSGLGLAQVYGIVKQHQGHIGVETQVDEGTTFTIYLRALAAPAPARPVAKPTGVPRGQGEVLLVVEDDVALRAALVDTLASLNYAVLEAVNGQEALTILEERGEEVALVLSDVVMPVMGGIALLHALRQQGRDTPMILLTGHPIETELEALRAQGLYAWLFKPPSMKQLAQTIAGALSD